MEYDLLNKILNPYYLADKQTVLEESKVCPIHQCKIIDYGVEYSLYSFDSELKSPFLPFFNNNCKEELPLKGLLSFCDYIMIASHKDKTYIIIIELKSSRNASADARTQIDAADTFLNYIVDTAVRVAPLNNYQDFDKKNIIVRKVIVINAAKNKPRTKAIEPYIDWSSEYIKCESTVFPILRVCLGK